MSAGGIDSGEQVGARDGTGVALGDAAPVRPLVITVHGTPAPQGSKRHVGRGIMVESSKAVKPWREAVKWAALAAIDHRDGVDGLGIPLNEPILLGPVVVTVSFTLARPKSHYRTGKHADQLRDDAPTRVRSKPDLDKLLRSTLDALGEACVWRDDSQVSGVVAAKVYGTTPGALITVEEVSA